MSQPAAVLLGSNNVVSAAVGLAGNVKAGPAPAMVPEDCANLQNCPAIIVPGGTVVNAGTPADHVTYLRVAEIG